MVWGRSVWGLGKVKVGGLGKVKVGVLQVWGQVQAPGGLGKVSLSPGRLGEGQVYATAGVGKVSLGKVTFRPGRFGEGQVWAPAGLGSCRFGEGQFWVLHVWERSVWGPAGWGRSSMGSCRLGKVSSGSCRFEVRFGILQVWGSTFDVTGHRARTHARTPPCRPEVSRPGVTGGGGHRGGHLEIYQSR